MADPDGRRALQSEFSQRCEEAFRRAAGLPRQTGLSNDLGAGTTGNAGTGDRFRSNRGEFPSLPCCGRLPCHKVLVARRDRPQDFPLFPSTSGALRRQGLTQVTGASRVTGEVPVGAIDDEGVSYGPLTLTIGAGDTDFAFLRVGTG